MARLARSVVLQDLRPAALLGGDGWLSGHLQQAGVPVAVTDFPSPRSLRTRLLGLGGFVASAVSLLRERGIRPSCLVANDHQECPMALALSQALGSIPVLAILRTPDMSRRDFVKYRCGGCQRLMAVGEEFLERVRSRAGHPVSLFQEGFSEAEFLPPRPLPPRCPRRLLVSGSEVPRKGFADFIAAVLKLEADHPDFPGFQCDFTGSEPDEARAWLARPARSTWRFLGRVEDYPSLVTGYDLVVHPSRNETFGLAPVEAWIAGTPTLVSLTGAIVRLDLPPAWTFPPRDIDALAARLWGLWENWPVLLPDLGGVQGRIRSRFHIDQTAVLVRREIDTLVG
jgi:glycosyltransferase involved in cell wall biosynthesis